MFKILVLGLVLTTGNQIALVSQKDYETEKECQVDQLKEAKNVSDVYGKNYGKENVVVFSQCIEPPNFKSKKEQSLKEIYK